MYSQTSNQNTQAANQFHRNKVRLAALPALPKNEHTYLFADNYWKICEHCKTLYKSKHACTQHCLFCASCSKHKPLTEMAGKAIANGYICHDCYASKPHTRNFTYTILLRL